MGYSIRDVDKLLLLHIKAQDYSVRISGMDTRFRLMLSTPDEMIARRRFPAINIESGFTISTPEFWQKEIKRYKVNQLDNTLVDVEKSRLIDIKYTYKVGFYVNYKSHCVYMEEQFLRLWANFFTLASTYMEGTERTFSVLFAKSGDMTNLDEQVGDMKLYRRDQVLVAHILMTQRTVESLIRPWKGTQIELKNEIIGGT